MILRQDGDYLVKVYVGPNDTETTILELNPTFIQADGLPFSTSGYYEYSGEDIILALDKELMCLKTDKLNEVHEEFDRLMANGSFATSLGFSVDNRRGEGKDDKDNVNSLIDLNNEPIYFKDTSNNFHILTIADLVTLKQEMIQDGLGKYQWKWTKENDIVSCTTLEELEAIMV